MVLSFAGSNTIKDEAAVRERLRKLLNFYAAKEHLTVMCAEGNRFDELVCEMAFEVRLRSRYPINVVAIALRLHSIKSHVLTALCDEVRYYTGRSNFSGESDDMIWLEESNILIVFLQKLEKSNAAIYYRYALDKDISTINIALDLHS